MSRPTVYRPRTFYGATLERVWPSGMHAAHVDLGGHYVRVMADSAAGIRDIIRETRRAHGLPVKRRRFE